MNGGYTEKQRGVTKYRRMWRVMTSLPAKQSETAINDQRPMLVQTFEVAVHVKSKNEGVASEMSRVDKPTSTGGMKGSQQRGNGSNTRNDRCRNSQNVNQE
jgi:hypothetical protein